MDHRFQKMAIGPVAIFGASNFPISYSVADGDTASALASGAPVILKAHNAHPGSSEIQGRAIRDAVRDCGLHEGVFSMLRGAGNAIGEALVDHPLVKAVTFTGSEVGGMALFRRAQQRLPEAQAARSQAIGDGFTERMLVNIGQACLKPAILIGIEGAGFDSIRDAMAKRVSEASARTMLTPGIHASYARGMAKLEDAGAHRVAEGMKSQAANDGQSALLEVEGAAFLSNPMLAEEVFGPAALLVKAHDEEEFLAIARSFRGQLSATMHLDAGDMTLAHRLLPLLERRTGRVVVNAFAHPQEVSFASIHGGPFPATSDSRFTSVGMTSIERFLRPVCYQGFPDELLPEALREANPCDVPRAVNG